MKFLAPSEHEKEELRMSFYSLDADMQLAIEELDHTLSIQGYQVVIKSATEKVLDIEIWIVNEH